MEQISLTLVEMKNQKQNIQLKITHWMGTRIESNSITRLFQLNRGKKHIHGGIRTHDLRIRSPARYPLRYADRHAVNEHL